MQITTVTYQYRSELHTMNVDSMDSLEESLIWIERHGARLIEVRSVQEEEHGTEKT